MPEATLEDRVAALEVKVGSQTVQEQLRTQAELIDERFVLHFAEHDRKWDAILESKLAPVRTDIAHLKLDVAGLKNDVAGLKSDVAGLKSDVAGLKTDLATVKDDVKKVLSKLKKRR